jgi:hypothetical protein
MSSKIALPIVAALFLSVGCSRTPPSPITGAPGIALDLQETAELIRASSAKRIPARTSDLQVGRTGHPAAYEKVASGEIVVVWGAKMPDEGAIESGTAPTAIIAYEKKAPTEGGYVLRQNGKVEPLTADQFKAEEKAK